MTKCVVLAGEEQMSVLGGCCLSEIMAIKQVLLLFYFDHFYSTFLWQTTLKADYLIKPKVKSPEMLNKI